MTDGIRRNLGDEFNSTKKRNEGNGIDLTNDVPNGLNGVNETAHEPIAVVGVGLRFPGGIQSPSELWSALLDGQDLLSDVPEDRYNTKYFHDSDTRKQGYVRTNRGGFLDDIYGFDAPFFNMFPAEAAIVDPQQRLALEAAYHALEDAGAPSDRVAGTRTSCFVGGFMYDHMCMQSEPAARDLAGPHAAVGIAVATLANRVSYKLDLRGPSVSLDTACSSSLVALHLACQSIWSGEADAAVAGGVNALLRPESSIILGRAGFLSPDGKCRSFDVNGNGYVRSEGAGMVYLKPLKQALKDRSRIYGVIRGSLVNSDGFTPEGLTVPSVTAQSTLLRSVYSRAGIDPSSVSYIQAHGPGTVVGDPKEAGALGGYLGQSRNESAGPLWVSSVKGNVGHLEGAAGIAGFITALLAAYYGKAAPQANHITPNPAIDFDKLRIGIALDAVELTPQKNGKVVVGVNSFGAGGTNAHAVIESPPPRKPRSRPNHASRAVIVSAKSPEALQATAKDLQDYIGEHRADIPDIIHTLNTRRTRHSHAAVISLQSDEDLYTKLENVSTGESVKDILSVNRTGTVDKVAFIFSGQGGQWAGMGKALADQEPVFAESVLAFDKIFLKCAGRSLLADVFNNDNASLLNKTVNAQPAICMIQIALARTLMSYGLEPHAVIGHSIGEVAAAHISGALSLEDTVRMLHSRATIQSKAAGKGAMLATNLSEDEAVKLLSRLQLSEDVEVATISGPSMTTLAGSVAGLETIASEVEKDKGFARFVKAEVPYHSRFMDPLQNELLEALAPYRGAEVQDIHLYSSVTTKRESGTHLTAEYWWKNARKPVRYSETVQAFLSEVNSPTLLVEIGPHPILVSGTRSAADELGLKGVHVLPAMVRNNDITPFVHAMGAAAVLCNKGETVDLDALNGGGGHHVSLPPYPFQRKHYSYEHPLAKQKRLMNGEHPFFDSFSTLTDNSRGIVKLRISSGTSPFLLDHVMDGSPIFPATGFVEASYLGAEKLVAGGQRLWIEGMTFDHALVLPQAGGHGDKIEWSPEVMLEVTSAQKDFVVSSRRVTGDASHGGGWTVSSRGRLNNLDQFDTTDIVPKDWKAVQARVKQGQEMSSEEFYDNLEAAGYRYGESFRGVKSIWQLGDETLAHVKLPESCESESGRFRFHPAMLDACGHASFAYWMTGIGIKHMYLPHRLEKVLVHDCRGIKEVMVYGHTTRFDDTYFTFDVCILDMQGKVLAVLESLTNKSILSTAIRPETEYETVFNLQPSPEYDCAEIEFQTVLFIGSESSPLSSVVEKTFPNAKIFHANPSFDGIFDATSLPLQLDRRSLIVLAPVDINKAQPEDTANEEEAAISRNISVILGIARCIQDAQVSTTFIALTRGACQTSMDEAVGALPASATIEAATRVLSNEQQQCRVRVIDLPIYPSESSERYEDEEEVLSLLSRELRQHGVVWKDTVVALRPGGKRLVRKVVAVDENKAFEKAAQKVKSSGGAYFCEADASNTAGGSRVGNIVVRRQQSYTLGPKDVCIAVQAAGVCFGDVLNATGNRSTTLNATRGVTESSIGHEVAGEVIEIGKDVKAVKVGQDVMGRVAKGFAGKVIVHEDLIMPVPRGFSMVEAAAVPMAYLTAYYSLSYLAQLSHGETVLINAAAGGVGFAAIQFAKMRGARIFATAGSPERRKHVQSLGAEKVFDSRSFALRDEIMKATNGRGVDVVLNCLRGSLLTQSAGCLARSGRFVEIGKITSNDGLNLSDFHDSSSIFRVDIDTLPLTRPALHRKLFEEVYNLLEAGEIPAPPVREYPVTALSSAFKDLLHSEIIGKAVISMKDSDFLTAERPTNLELQSDRTYLITGGSSGFGLQMAKFLANRGAKHLVLVSRSGPKTTEDELLLAGIRDKGVTVYLESADITDTASLKALAHDDSRPPLAGVIHSAAVLHDLYAHNTTMDDYLKVFRPKSIGAWNLHAATTDLPLDFFVMISSMSATLSFAGQLSYSSSNHYLDGLADFRRSRGLPALSVNLGLLGTYAGMTRKSTLAHQMVDILSSEGHRNMLLSAVLDAFERAMLDRAVTRMPVSIDWGMWLKAYPHLLYDNAFSHLNNTSSQQQSSSSSSSAKNSWVGLTGQALVDAIIEKLREGLSRIVGLELSQVTADAKVDSFAPDSITMTQVSSMILREFRVRYAIMKLLSGPTLREIATEVAASAGTDQVTDQADSVPQETISSTLPDGLCAISPLFVKGNQSKSRGGPKLICLHSMGTGASLYTQFLLNEPAGFEVLAVQLPGRENRSHESFPQDAFAVAQEIAESLLADHKVSSRDVVWGHSFGGLLAFLVLRYLRQHNRTSGKADEKLPRLVITGTIAPHLGASWQKRDLILQGFHEDLSPEYLLAVSRYVDDADFVRALMYGMRMDGPMLMSFQYDETEEPLNVPITAFAATQDDVVYPDEVEQWRQQAGDQSFEMIKVDGDHWFIHRNRSLIREKLEAMSQGW